MDPLPTAAIIGAGSSGIAAAKALYERGVPFACFEASDRVGGNWVFGNRNGMSAAYRQLHINTSRERMEYSDYPMPKSYPDYPHHSHVAEYFDAYVDHFGLRDAIRLQTRVQRASRRADGVWELTLADGSVESFDALLVANGHHRDPRWPEPPFPGQDAFSGRQMHAHAYRDIVLAAMRRRYVASERHTIQVDFDEYLRALGAERRAGARRARERGFRLPVAARAADAYDEMA